METNALPTWMKWVNLASLLLYGIAVVAYLRFAFIMVEGLWEIMPLFTLGTRDPGTVMTLLKVLAVLVALLPLVFSLLPYTTVRSCARLYVQGGAPALKEAGGQLWGIAVFAQVLSWGSLIAFIVLLPNTSFFRFVLFGAEDFKAYAEGMKSFSDNMIWVLIMPFSLLFIPGCLRLAPLVFFFRKMRGLENA